MTTGVDRWAAWKITLAVWAGTTFLVAYEIVPASILPLVRASLDVGPTAAGWLISAFLLAMAVFSIPVGIALDKVDNRRAIYAMAGLAFVSMVWAWNTGVMGRYRLLLAARFVGGVAAVGYWTAGVNIVGASFSADRQGTAIAAFATSVPAGFAVGHLTGPSLAEITGWAGTFPVYGALVVAATLGFWLTARDVPIAVDPAVPTRGDFAAVFRNRAVWGVGGLAFAAFSLNLVFNSWLPAYLVERFALPLVGGAILAAGFPVIGIVARVIGGVASDRYFGGRRRPLVLGSFLLVIPVIPGIVLIDTIAVIFIGLVIAGFVTQLGLVLLIPLVRELVAANVVGTALAVLNTVGFLGAFSAPVVAGALIEHAGFTAAFGYAGLLAVVGVGLTALISEPT